MIDQAQLLDTLAADVNATTQAVQRMRQAHTDPRLTARPGPGSWSAAECIEHLCVTARLYYHRIGATLNRAGEATGEYRPGRFARWFIAQASPTNPRKLPAPKMFQPEAGQVSAEAFDAFAAQQQDLLALIEQARLANINRPKFGTPITRLLRFSAGEALELMVRHQQRHLQQAQRALSAAGSA